MYFNANQTGSMTLRPIVLLVFVSYQFGLNSTSGYLSNVSMLSFLLEFGRIFAGEGDIVDEEINNLQKKSAVELIEEAKKGKELKQVDHSTIKYAPFRKNIYIVPRSLAKLSKDEIKDIRESLAINVRGKECPAPVDNWEQCGLSDRMLDLLKLHNLENPFAIQRQAIPAIMCGRDIIGVAKTGSGDIPYMR